MKKPTLETVLAKKAAPIAGNVPLPPASRVKAYDGKLTTSLRIDAAKLEALKIIALRKRVRVNDLVVEGIDHVIALNKDLAA